MRISEIPHVDHGRIAVCACQASFRIDDATVVEEFSLPDLPPPESIGRYRILRYVGRGALNCVYEGTDPDTGEHVAIKTLLPEYAGDKPSREQFLHAAKIYAKAVHPNIVKVFETGKNADGVPFLAMEFLSGGTLADRMTENRHFSVREAAEIGVAVCRALAVTSRLGIVHRDIKPDNIMISADGQYKLTDLGLAKFDAASGTGSATLILDETAQAKPPVKTSFGTLEYMSPEQYIDAETCDIRSDIYSLGVTLYNLAAGRLPFEPQTRSELRHMHLSVEPVVPSTFESEIPLDFDYIVLHCIQKTPDDRYPTPEELLADLEAFLAGQPLPSTTRGAVPIVHQPGSSRRQAAKTGPAWVLPTVAAVLVLLILCLTGLFFLTGLHRQKQAPKQQTESNDFEFTGQSATTGNAGTTDRFGGGSGSSSTRSSSKALINDVETSIVDKEREAQIASFFEEAKKMAEQALEAGTGYQNAIDNLESFTASEEYSVEALGIILELKKASEASVRTLMNELDELAAPYISAGNYDAAILIYDRHEKIEPLKQESMQSRNDKKRELERMKQNNVPDGDPEPAAETTAKPAAETTAKPAAETTAKPEGSDAT